MKLWLPIVIAAILIVAPHRANAYVDLSSATVVIQTVVAILVGGLVTLKVYWQSVSSSVRRWLGIGIQKPDEATDSGET